MKRLVLVLIGMPGSGKSTAAGFFRKKNFPVVRMGDITDEILIKEKILPNEANECYFRRQIRKLYGRTIYAKISLIKIKKFHRNYPLVVVDGMRSIAEYNLFRSIYKKKLKILCVKTHGKLRHRRLLRRKIRPLSNDEARNRDRAEKSLGFLKIVKYADYTIQNRGNRRSFIMSLEKVVTTINQSII